LFSKDYNAAVNVLHQELSVFKEAYAPLYSEIMALLTLPHITYGFGWVAEW
jgi:hypothetical protein